MTFDDLKRALDEVGLRLDETTPDPPRPSHALLHRSRSALGPLRWTLVLEATLGGLVLLLLTRFLAVHAEASWPVLAAGWSVLMAQGLYLLATVRQLVQLAWIDFAAPMPEVQHRLAALWLLRSRVVRNTFLVAPLLWLPLLIVALAWIAGVDLVAEASLAWVLANLAFGLAVLIGGLWVARARPEWAQRSVWLRRATDHLGGESLRRALRLAEDAIAFEHTPDACPPH